MRFAKIPTFSGVFGGIFPGKHKRGLTRSNRFPASTPFFIMCSVSSGGPPDGASPLTTLFYHMKKHLSRKFEEIRKGIFFSWAEPPFLTLKERILHRLRENQTADSPFVSWGSALPRPTQNHIGGSAGGSGDCVGGSRVVAMCSRSSVPIGIRLASLPVMASWTSAGISHTISSGK